MRPIGQVTVLRLRFLLTHGRQRNFERCSATGRNEVLHCTAEAVLG